jgi:hypothetical protein
MFLRRAVIATAAVGVGSTLVSKSLSIVPESSASSVHNSGNAKTSVTTDSAPCNEYCGPGSLAVFDGCSDITGAMRCAPAYLKGTADRKPILSISNSGSYCHCCNVENMPTGISAHSCFGIGVFGKSPNSVGVYGSSCTCYGVVGVSIACYGAAGVYGSASGCGSPGVYGVSFGCLGVGVSGTSCSGPGVLAQSKASVAFQAETPYPTIASFVNSGSSKTKTAEVMLQNGCSTSWYAGVGGAGNSSGLKDGQFFFVTSCQPKVVLNRCGKVGIGTNSPNTTLQVGGGVSFETKIENDSYTMTSSDFAILADASTKEVVITLPPANNTGQVVLVKKIDISKNYAKIQGQGTDMIEGKTSKELTTQYASLTLLAGGNGTWYILSSGD